MAVQALVKCLARGRSKQTYLFGVIRFALRTLYRSFTFYRRSNAVFLKFLSSFCSDPICCPSGYQYLFDGHFRKSKFYQFQSNGTGYNIHCWTCGISRGDGDFQLITELFYFPYNAHVHNTENRNLWIGNRTKFFFNIYALNYHCELG